VNIPFPYAPASLVKRWTKTVNAMYVWGTFMFAIFALGAVSIVLFFLAPGPGLMPSEQRQVEKINKMLLSNEGELFES
jgi:hypothetical protein